MSGMTSSWYDDDSSDGERAEKPDDRTRRELHAADNGDDNIDRRLPYAEMSKKPAAPTSTKQNQRKNQRGRRERPPGESVMKGGADAPFLLDPPSPDVRNRKIVTKSGWRTETKKRKRERSGGRFVPDLKAAPTSSSREVYVQGLDYSQCECHADLEDIVYFHCKNRGVMVIDACTIPKAKNRVEAGCKVTVKIEDYERVMNPRFWPSDTTVRDWEVRPRGGRNAEPADDE